jgi:hypothetical protein
MSEAAVSQADPNHDDVDQAANQRRELILKRVAQVVGLVIALGLYVFLAILGGPLVSVVLFPAIVVLLAVEAYGGWRKLPIPVLKRTLDHQQAAERNFYEARREIIEVIAASAASVSAAEAVLTVWAKSAPGGQEAAGKPSPRDETEGTVHSEDLAAALRDIRKASDLLAEHSPSDAELAHIRTVLNRALPRLGSTSREIDRILAALIVTAPREEQRWIVLERLSDIEARLAALSSDVDATTTERSQRRGEA